MGYEIFDGLEVDTVEYNFDALNTPEAHPSRDPRDTFYINDKAVLRTHTSPSQIRAMQASEPPVYIASLGRTYRRDTIDATHTPIFHQVEALAVDRDITLADLRGTMRAFAEAIFGGTREIRMRTSFFPFTEPSVEFDMTCFICDGAGCSVCKHSGWIEMGGAGRGRPERPRVRRLRPERVAGLRVGARDRPHRVRAARPARPAPVLGKRHPLPLAVLKVPASWLREYVDFELPLEDLARKLVFTSCEVDRIVPRGVPDVDGNLGKFLVGKVLEAGKHPNADRLQLCLVDVGEGEPRQIVCGAWNFGAGATVAVALPGALLPGADQPLGEAKLRGELSRGMILAEDEVDLGTDHSGIMVLGDGFEPGTPLADVLPLTDDVLEIETGFNRPDLASIYGIAREVAAVTGGTLAPPPGRDPERAGDEPVDVRVEDFVGCPRYVGRLFRGATIGESPHWLKARLLAAGMRPISNVVDVTNYVMLALGSPLHAFDLTRLDEGRIVVRRAHAGREDADARRT